MFKDYQRRQYKNEKIMNQKVAAYECKLMKKSVSKCGSSDNLAIIYKNHEQLKLFFIKHA